MKYIAYVKQEAYGCDYSIACGRTLWWLEAQDYDSAIQELRNMVIGEFSPEYDKYDDGYWDESKLKEVILFEVEKEAYVPLATWYAEAEEYARDYKARIAEEAERQEYERLKEKFG